MKRTIWNRILSALLCAVMVIGFIPGGLWQAPNAAAAEAQEELTIDFAALGEELSQQSWWNDLVIGSKGAAPMGQNETAQYDALLSYLSQNKNWTINETRSQFKNMYQAKELVFNTDPDKDWAMRYYAGYAGVESHDSMYLELNVTQQQAGWYSMSVGAFLESILSEQADHGFQGGGGYGIITVNDEEVLSETSFQGSDMVSDLDCGYVQLHEGINTIRIRNTKDVFGGSSHAIRSLCINHITFRKAEVADGPAESLRLDFKAFALKASAQPWWDDLIDPGYDDVRVMGYADSNPLPEQTSQAYGQLLQYMENNEYWKIDESKSLIALPDALKRIVIDASENPCGIRFYPAWFKGQNGNAAYSQLTFTVNVPKGAEGEYEFLMDIFKESPADGVPQVQNMNPGGGYGNILVNGELVAEEFDFASRTGKAYRSVTNFGVVELQAGSNTITIDLVKDYNGGGNNLHRTISLNAMEFRSVDAAQEPAAVYDFAKAAELTAQGYENIETYSHLDVDTRLSAPWKFAEKSGAAFYDTEEQSGVLGGDYVRFTLQVEQDGWYQPVLNSLSHPQGEDTMIWLAPAGEEPTEDAYFAGTVEAYAPEKTVCRTALRPMRLQAGEYTLTLQQSGTAFWFTDLQLMRMEEPELVLVSGSVEEKAKRTVSLPIYGFWNGEICESLTGAQWDVQVSDPDNITATVTEASADLPANVEIKGKTDGEYTVTVTATLHGVQAQVDIPVCVTEPAQLVSLEVTVPGVERQTARNTIQQLNLEMLGSDGEQIYGDEVELTYETDAEGIVEIKEENGTFRTLKNGDVTITVTASAGGVTLTDTVELTVADTGENTLAQTDSDFENGADGWMFYGVDHQVVQEGDNHVLKFSIDPNVSYAQLGGAGSEVRICDGHFAKLLPGHMYEFTAKVKTTGFKRAPGAVGDLVFAYQLYDYHSNARLSVLEDEVLVQTGIDYQALTDWTEVKMTVRAPVEADGPIYAMPRMVIFPGIGTDNQLTGYEGTVWLDDLQIAEVGFEGVETQFKEPLKDTEETTTFYIKPYTTTGSYIDIDEDKISQQVTLQTSNDDVVTIKSNLARTSHADGGNYPAAEVGLHGLNDTASLSGDVTIHGMTHSFAAQVEVFGLAEKLRDVNYTLDGFEAAVLKKGETAQGILAARTTQLNPLTEEEIRTAGAVYFTTSNEAVATVDQQTGDVTCTGEGTAEITAYVLLDGVSASASAVITVTDDTDLAQIEIVAAADYVGTGNALQLTATGKKASGGAADMSRYPVAWFVDEQSLLDGIASIDDSGRLVGLKPGTVTVTATVGVMRQAVSATATIEVIDNARLAGEDIILDFTDGHLMNIESCTLQDNGVAVNRDLTYENGKNAETVRYYGFAFMVPAGEGLAFDFTVSRDGWYNFEATGGLFEGGNISDIFIDNSYVGTIDFCKGVSGMPYSAHCSGNTIWLEAGKHTYRVLAATSGVQYLGKLILHAAKDPNEVQVTVEADRTHLLEGQTSLVTVTATDANGKNYPLKSTSIYEAFSNYTLLISADPTIAKVSGNTIVGVKAGKVNITVFCRIGTTNVVKVLPVEVFGESIATVEVTAQATTVRPDAGTVALTATALDLNATPVSSGYSVQWHSGNEAVASVDQSGLVTLTGKEGSCYITAVVTENTHQVEGGLWLTVTSGKSEPTIYTWQERANAQENVLKYDWAWSQKETAVKKADFVVNNLDLFYALLIHEGLPRATATYHAAYQAPKLCDYCGIDLTANFGVYPWIVDPINNPWKITCPACKHDFPSNDFGAYFASGVDEQGSFDASRADHSLLVNTSYPDKPADWGVDDGNGWYTGEKSAGTPEVYHYIAYYLHNVFLGYGKSSNSLISSMKSLIDAYILTGDEKYGSAGAILLDRVADIYPGYDMALYAGQGYCCNDGYSGKGKFAGSIDEGNEIAPTLARAADAFWPCMTNEDVISYLREHAAVKGVQPEQITPDYVRRHIDDGILRTIGNGCLSSHVAGNFGMPQESMALAAVALNILPESEEMIDWVFRYGLTQADGANVLYNLVNLVDRNGFGNEVSYQYNRLWYINLSGVADALDGYTAVEGADLWKNAKFVDLFRGFGRTVLGGRLLPQVGEAGSVQSENSILDLDRSYFLTAFQKTGDPFLAQMIYAGNGNSVSGLHADIYSKNPEAVRTQIQSIVDAQGKLDMGSSAQLAGFGLTMLRKGPETYLGKSVNAHQYFNHFLYYGLTGSGHGQLEALNMGVFAFGLDLTSSMGYPTAVSSASGERQQFVRNTVSHNTVVVDDEGQLEMPYGGFPLHYDDSDTVQLVDVDCANAYAQTDIYRRTLVTVEAPNGVPYTVDFFRVLGGSEHVYSFHAATDLEPATGGLEFIHQPMGSYAGADVPYGIQTYHETNHEIDFNQGSGYSWLKNVYRDGDPDNTFYVDWKIKDFNHQLSTTNDIHMRLTMLSEEPMTEVALADAVPPQNSVNPDVMKYLLVRKSGLNGQDTLFTSVIEPWQGEMQVVSSELVDMELAQGSMTGTDRTAAIKLTMADGRVDYVVYATNPDCTYRVDGTFDFSGFVGVCSYYGDTLVYAYGNEATQVADVIEMQQGTLTGTVTDFTQGLSLEGYTITVQLDQTANAEDLVGDCIYVQNDQTRNAVYQIQAAQITGKTALLHIGHETLVRSYLDGSDLDKGFVHNIRAGDSVRIPLAGSFDAAALFCHTTDQVIRAGNKLSLTTGVADSGVTYEADGLVTGMKLDANTGALTWTTSKTNVGRYPITIKAVQDGEVVATMSFVVYVVSYTGSTYAADACSHTKAVTYEADGIIETVCPACSTITKTEAEQAQKFNIAGANMTLGNELKLNILVKTSDLTDGTYTAKITHGDTVTEAVFAKYNSSYSYVTYTVSAKQMADAITVEVYDEEGNAVSNTYETSVRTYAMNLLGNAAMTAKVKTLVVDMLNYGSETQTYFGYNESDLANTLLTEEQKALATESVTCVNRQVKGTNFYGTNLTLGDKILLNMFFKNVTDEMYAKVIYTDYTGKVKTTQKDLTPYSGSVYKVVIDDIVLADAFSTVTVTVYNADGSVHGTGTDSVESYIARTGDSALNEAIMKFAYSAKAYLG